MKHGGWKIFSCVLERPPNSWVVGFGQCCFHSSCRAHAAMPIAYNNKHTHTHMLRVHSAKRSSQVRSTTVSASFSDLNAPTCAPPTDPGGKYQLTNLSPRAPKLCKCAICRGTTAACRSAPEWQTGEECRKRKIGVSPSGIVKDWAVVHPSPSDIIKGRIVELKM